MRYRKMMIAILLSLLALSACSSEGAEQENLDTRSDYEELPEEFDNGSTQVSMSSNQDKCSLPVKEMEITLTNSGTEPVGYENSLWLEKLQEDSWYEVPYNGHLAFGDISLRLEPGQNEKGQIPLEYLDYRLTSGTYRIVKTFFIEEGSEEITLAAPFEIKD